VSSHGPDLADSAADLERRADRLQDPAESIARTRKRGLGNGDADRLPRPAQRRWWAG